MSNKPSKEIEQKQNEIEKEVEELNDSSNYMVCLKKPKNENAIEEAWQKNDFCTIEKIFRKCGVPEEHMRKRMIEVLDCKDGKPQVWV